MVLGKEKKEAANAAESSSKLLLSNKKTLKTSKSLKPEPKIVKKSQNKKSTKTTVKSQRDQKAEENLGKTMLGKSKKEVANDAESSSKLLLSDKKTLKSVPNPKIVKKSQNQNSAKAEEKSQGDQKAEENLGGLIFMCNSKTKPDCFRYQVMGVATNKQALVMGIKPGLKLFLYDFDLKLMHGIYMASSTGGRKLEPAAFGGAFPVQVRFKVQKDCLPLPESVFKKAIKDNYNENAHKFKTELTVPQVKKLTELFRPVPKLRSNSESFVPEPEPTQVICRSPLGTVPGEEALREQVLHDHYTSGEATGKRRPSDQEMKKFPKRTVSTQRETVSPDPLFLTEKEYRSYGLRRNWHISTSDTAPVAPTLDPYRNGQEREELLRNAAPLQGDVASTRNEAVFDPLFLSEKEYRAYGLGGRRELPSLTTHTTETTASAVDYHARDPYYPHHYGTASLDPYYPHHYGTASLDPYLTLPSMVAAHSEYYSLTTGRESYITDSNLIENDVGNHSRRGVPDETERLYSTYASRPLSDYSQKDHLGNRSDLAPPSVSSLYSFADLC